MYTLTTHFEQLLKSVRPPAERIEKAKTVPEPVCQFLKETPQFATVAPHTAPVGSYAQRMSAGDVKDVDLLVFVPGDPSANEPEAMRLVLDLRKALDGLPTFLNLPGYTEVDLERARRSVHVYLPDFDFHLDVVPAIAPNGTGKPIWVPDRGFKKWIESHPLGVVRRIAELEGLHPGKVRALGILLKHWRNTQMKSRKPKSYWLTALLIEHVETKLEMTKPIAELFRDLIVKIEAKYASTLAIAGATPNVKDPMLGHNVSWNWQRTHFETFMRRLGESVAWAAEALETDNRDTAIKKWRKVFGEQFPVEVEEPAKTWAAAARPGSSAITSLGLLGSTGAASTIKTKRTTFYRDA